MTRIRKSLAWAASAILFTSVIPGMAAEPAERPLAQLREEFLTWKYGLFIHFNIATYNDREWANGYEDPLTFAPANLDCDQWAAATKAGGMKYAVLTVKHTEGYSHDDKNTDIHSYEYPIYRNERGYPKPENTIPSEVCDTIDSRGNWFWNAKVESQMRSAEDVVGVLRMCNERRANYLLNVAPNRDGRIPDTYVKRMKEIADLWQNR